MTLNSVIQRIRENSLAHKQIKNFYFGRPTDFLTDKTTQFASVFLQDNGGVINIQSKSITFTFRLYLLDLVNVSEKAKQNETEVLSDMLQAGSDLVAIFNHSSFTDWKVDFANSFEFLVESFDDLVAGVVIDMNIIIPYAQDVCAVPTNSYPSGTIIITPDMKLVYDEKYVSNGTEGTILNIPEVAGKEILLVTRESSVIYPITTGSPSSTEYLFNGTTIQLGATVNPSGGERFLILYRNQ